METITESSAYRFDGLGNYFIEERNLTQLMSLTEGRERNFCWYHVALPNGNKKLSSFEKPLTDALCPPLKHQDISMMVGAGPFCGHVDGALFFRVNSSGPALSGFSLRLAARVTENSVITVSMGLHGRLDFSSSGQFLPSGIAANPYLVKNDEMGGSAVTAERDPESLLAMTHKEADNSVPKTVGNLLAYIVDGCMDHLQGFVTDLEMDLDRIENQMGFFWRYIDNVRAQREIGNTTNL